MPSQKQHELLLQAPPPASIEEKDGFSYISHQAVRLNLIRVFGFGNWSFTVDEVYLLHEGKKPRKQGGENWVITYRVVGTLAVTFDDGRRAYFTESAVDSSFHPQYDQCHDHAVKGAASNCLRRCAMNLGSLFGLGLYFKGNRGEVVQHTIDTLAQADAQAVSDIPEGDDTRPDLTTPEGVSEAIDALRKGGVVSDQDGTVQA